MFNKRSVREFLIITFGTAVIAAAVYFFMLPSHVIIGSGSALASAAVDMLNAYFSETAPAGSTVGENALIP
mgnify:CR=1 FL=1